VVEQKTLNLLVVSSNLTRITDKCLKIVDIYLHFLAKSQREKTTLNFYTESDLVEFDYLPDPDCYISIEQLGKRTIRYFIEVVNPDSNKYERVQLVKKYLEYLDEGTWKKATGYLFPTILLYCPDQKTKHSLDKYLEETIYEEYEMEKKCIINLVLQP
jgi:hypothetical protein